MLQKEHKEIFDREKVGVSIGMWQANYGFVRKSGFARRYRVKLPKHVGYDGKSVYRK